MGLQLALVLSLLFPALGQTQYQPASMGLGYMGYPVGNSCNHPKAYLNSSNSTITQNYRTRDVSDKIREVTQYIKTCKISLRSVGVPDDFYSSLLKETYKNELARIKMDIELYSKTGKIEAQEKSYREYAKKLGHPKAAVERYIQEQQTIARAAFEKEKQSCTSVDLRDKMGPIRNQDSIGWCYAFAAADLASYKLQKQISAADIALTHNKDFLNDVARLFGKNESTFEGGFPQQALKKAMRKGLCLEKDLPSEDNANSEFVDRLSNIDKMGRLNIDGKNSNCNSLHNQTKAIFPNINVRELQEILKKSSTNNFIENMANKTCGDRIKADFEVETISKLDSEKFAKVLDQQMDNKNPVSLTYDATVLFNRRDYATSNFVHASVVVGRRHNQKTGQCEYLIRNSWGRGCGTYDPQLACDNGNIWIPKADILKRSHEASYIK